jgi:hypothetical protein
MDKRIYDDQEKVTRELQQLASAGCAPATGSALKCGLTDAELRFILGSARFMTRAKRLRYERELQRREATTPNAKVSGG